MPDLAALRPGDPASVGEYTLSGRLGEGGQGTVYLATAANGARVAVKLLRADLAGDHEASERFVREVAMARRVAPFCTAQVIETGLFGRLPYIVSEYIDGPTLDDVVRTDGPRSGTSLHRLAIGTVTALVAIHQAGIVHRDFKPSNVVLASDGPRVIDFGIARALDLTSSLTASAIGTPSFMAPEQLTDAAPGPWSDMFAWACTLLFAASGQPPFGQDSLAAVVNRIIHTDADVTPIADPALRSLVADCLAKDPARRPTASEALMRLLGHGPGGASPGLLRQGTAVAASGPVPPMVSGAMPPPGWAPPPVGPMRQTYQQPPPPPFYQQQLPLPLPPTRTGGRRGTGWIVATAVACTLALATVGTIVVVRLASLPDPGITSSPTPDNTNNTANSPSYTPTPSPTPTPTPTSSTNQTTRTIALPGSSVEIRENGSDPIKLAAYSLDSGKRVYVRRAASDDFTLNSRYYEYALAADGTRALATDVDYSTDGYGLVSIIDHRTGAKRTVKLSVKPVFPTTPRWSPDGKLGLVTLFKDTGGKSVEYGYGVIDVERGTGKVYEVKEKGAGEWRFFWDADGQAVGTWVGGRMKFYDLDGNALRTLTGAGSPVWVEGDDVSPSGGLFLSHCGTAGDTLCARSTTGGGTPVTIPFASNRLIGWWDDQHLAVWRAKGAGYEAVVIDLKGQISRVLATAAKQAEFDKMGLRYSRGTP
ncbi:serine/threonine-protein kinase [Nonomuraea sp. NEAU-A123]|uniref:serine/threonine-protein kinase n=1 Tax=Nonomuraea sp. NEAU-A123 TaxID=2839649 RepID=UPI001BE43901|nr:serine/threonine-protein kinase [Nonomuraea sp. NEAU-A123]MBT2228954.1 serine/threonine-protein kinase [Nonomuraea sp. NEAU-A123]